MAHINLEIEANEQDIAGIIARLNAKEKVHLNEESLEILRHDLLNFVHRVVSSPKRLEGELEILPTVTELLLRHFGS